MPKRPDNSTNPTDQVDLNTLINTFLRKLLDSQYVKPFLPNIKESINRLLQEKDLQKYLDGVTKNYLGKKLKTDSSDQVIKEIGTSICFITPADQQFNEKLALTIVGDKARATEAESLQFGIYNFIEVMIAACGEASTAIKQKYDTGPDADSEQNKEIQKETAVKLLLNALIYLPKVESKQMTVFLARIYEKKHELLHVGTQLSNTEQFRVNNSSDGPPRKNRYNKLEYSKFLAYLSEEVSTMICDASLEAEIFPKELLEKFDLMDGDEYNSQNLKWWKHFFVNSPLFYDFPALEGFSKFAQEKLDQKNQENKAIPLRSYFLMQESIRIIEKEGHINFFPLMIEGCIDYWGDNMDKLNTVIFEFFYTLPYVNSSKINALVSEMRILLKKYENLDPEMDGPWRKKVTELCQYWVYKFSCWGKKTNDVAQQYWEDLLRPINSIKTVPQLSSIHNDFTKFVIEMNRVLALAKTSSTNVVSSSDNPSSMFVNSPTGYKKPTRRGTRGKGRGNGKQDAQVQGASYHQNYNQSEPVSYVQQPAGLTRNITWYCPEDHLSSYASTTNTNSFAYGNRQPRVKYPEESRVSIFNSQHRTEDYSCFQKQQQHKRYQQRYFSSNLLGCHSDSVNSRQPNYSSCFRKPS